MSVALRKVQMGAMPDVEGQLSSFLGMPSCCRKSVLAPLDHIKELSLQWVLMPKLDSRGCIQVRYRLFCRSTAMQGGNIVRNPLIVAGIIFSKTSSFSYS